VQNRHPLADCQNCPLFDSDYAYVPSFGPKKADIALVGQNPGSQEIRIGKPFTGPSGRLLDQVLKYYHLDRSQMLVTNAVSCTHRHDSTMKPPAAAVAACHPRLLHELRVREVKKVVALGNVPAQGLLHTRDTITRLRVGSHRRLDYAEDRRTPGFGFDLYCTFHPAYCLRSSSGFPSMANDFGKLVHPPPPWQEPTYVVWEDSVTAIRGIKEMQRRGIRNVSLDIETSVPTDKDTSFDHPYRYKILCVGLAYSATKAVVIGRNACQDSIVLKILKQFLAKCKHISTQNGKFDKQGQYAKGCDFTFTGDTMLSSYVMDERPGIHGLKVQLEEKLGYPRYADEIAQYVGKGKAKSFANIPLDILYRYNAYDTCGTFALDEYNMCMLQEDDWADPVRERFDGERWGLVKLYDFMVTTANNLAYVELNGFPVDLRYNTILTRKYDGILAGLEQDMFDTLDGFRFNPRSPKQLKSIFANMGVPLPKVRRPNGTLSETTSAAALQELYDRYRQIRSSAPSGREEQALEPLMTQVYESQEEAFLRALLAYRKAAKTNGTYVRGLRKHVWKGRVFPTVMIHSTVSGRTSQKRPSLQVIPHSEEIKRQFTTADFREWAYGEGPGKPEDDYHVLCEFDYKQIELRVLTWLAQEEYFRAIFEDESRDLFKELMPVVRPERSRKTNIHPKDQRNIVKAFVYGLAYGREAGSIAEEYGIPDSDAQAMYRDFFRAIPNIVRFRNQVKLDAVGQKDLVTPFGRRRRFWLVTAENKKEIQNEALSFFPQSIASDIAIQAFNWLRPKLKGKAYVRNLVHDAIFTEQRAGDLVEVANTVVETMKASAYSIMGDYVKIGVDVEVGRTWGDMIHLEDWLEGKRPYPTALAIRPSSKAELSTTRSRQPLASLTGLCVDSP
jgi:uracil-DNA glycosylase